MTNGVPSLQTADKPQVETAYCNLETSEIRIATCKAKIFNGRLEECYGSLRGNLGDIVSSLVAFAVSAPIDNLEVETRVYKPGYGMETASKAAITPEEISQARTDDYFRELLGTLEVQHGADEEGNPIITAGEYELIVQGAKDARAANDP